MTHPACVAFTGGPITTMDPAIAAPEVVVIRDGVIDAVGPAGLLDEHPDAVRHDLAGRRLVPGFIDAHCHLSIAALLPRWADCGGVDTVEALGAILQAQARREPGAGWVRGDGWDEVGTGLQFDRYDLDDLGLDRPVIVVHKTFHQCVVSSLGLEVLGIGRKTGGDADEVERGPDGAPTGVLVERGFGRAHSVSMAAYHDPDQWTDHIAARARSLFAEGITAVHDAAVDPAAEAVYGAMARAGTLPLSVLAMPHPVPFLTHAFGSRLDGPPTGEGDAVLRTGPLKLFADGGVAPAIDVRFGGAHLAFGYLHPDLRPALVEAVRRGFRVGVHAMGNAGVAATIDAFRAAARARRDDDHRFRVEHAGMASPDQARDLAALGAVAVVQPGFVDHVGESARDFQPDDAAWLPFAMLAEAGVPLAGSSDDPCAHRAPLVCAHFGEHRRSASGIRFGPDQAVPFETWLEAYTVGAAHAGGQEHERGRIAPGLEADLVVLEGPDSGGGDHRAVAETWVRGQQVYPAPVL